jgi:glycosyltransferase involved in cell wall biosynthesis
MLISIIIPVYNEENHINECLDSVLSSGYPLDKMEIFVIDGGSGDKTIDIVNSYKNKYPCICLLNNSHKTVPYAMNIGIRASHGEFVFCLGAHSNYAKEYFFRLANTAERLKADCTGGICITGIKTKNAKTLAIREVLSNKYGVGNSLFRIGVDKIIEVDTVPFGCYRRDVFERFGYFDERLTRNQDIEFNKRIKRNGGKIFLIPEVHSVYYARENYLDLAKNNYQNGLWNILTCYYTKKYNSLSLRHYVPLIFVSLLILPVIFMPINNKLLLINIPIVILYFVIVLIISLDIYIRKKIKIQNTVISFAVLHLSYGFGSINGLLKAFVLLLKFNSSKKYLREH